MEVSRSRVPPASRLELRADSFAYIALAGLPLVFLVIFVLLTIRSYFRDSPLDSASLLFWDLFCGAWAVILFAVVKSVKINIRDGILCYCFLWHCRTVALADIDNARVITRARGLGVLKTSPAHPPYSLLISPVGATGIAPFNVNIKFLSRKDLQILIAALGAR